MQYNLLGLLLLTRLFCAFPVYATTTTSDTVQQQKTTLEAIAEVQGYAKTLHWIESRSSTSSGNLKEASLRIQKLLDIMKTARVLLEDSIIQNNVFQTEHQFRKITLARTKAQQIFRSIKYLSDDALMSEPGVTIQVDAPQLNQLEIGMDPLVEVGDAFPAPPPSP